MIRFDEMNKFFDVHEKELSEVGITGGTAIDFSVLLIAVNFHQRLKKLDAEHDQRSSFGALSETPRV